MELQAIWIVLFIVVLITLITGIGTFKETRDNKTRRKSLIVTAMKACINAYKGEEGKVDETLFEDVKWFYEHHSAKFFIGWHKETETLYIVFRGTPKDGWGANFDYKQIKWNFQFLVKGRWHRGFLKHDMLAVINTIYDCINEFQIKRGSRPFKIIVTGHSKGGSLSLLCAFWLRKMQSVGLLCNIQKIACISFAPARVCSPIGAKQYKRAGIPTMIIKNGNDTVSKVPFVCTPGLVQRKYKFFKWKFWPTIQLWKHPAKVTHIGRAWYIVLMHLLPFARFFGNPLDHKPENYMKSVMKLK